MRRRDLLALLLTTSLALVACKTEEYSPFTAEVSQRDETEFFLSPTPRPSATAVLIPLLSAQKVARLEASPSPTPTPELKLLITPGEAELESDSQIQLVAWKQRGKERARVQQPLWVSKNPEIALIQPDGILTARKVGTTTVDAVADQLVGTMLLTVKAGPLAQILIEPETEIKLKIKENQQFLAKGTDRAGNPLKDVLVAWSLSDPAKGTLNSAGLFTSGSVRGTVRIIATSGQFKGQKSIIIE